MKTKMHGIKHQSGFTLIESLIVSLIFIALIAAALVGKSQWDTRTEINNMSSSLQTIAEVSKTSFGGAPYGAANTALNFTLATNRAFANPRYRVTTTGTTSTVTNTVNGAVVILAQGINFSYSESGLNAAICAGVIPKLSSPTWLTVQIGSAAVRTVPVTPIQAAADCDALAGGAILLTSNG